MQTADRNTKYTSKTIQSEILEAAASCISDVIKEEVSRACKFALMADEAKDISNIKQLSVCVCYVDIDSGKVKESFLCFVAMQKYGAVSIAQTILDEINKAGLSIKNCIAQCYDGASIMSGTMNGVQTVIREASQNPCPYIHCMAHRLNLVVVDIARGIPQINKMFRLMEKVHSFFSISAKHYDVFMRIQELHGLRKQETPALNDTRWICRYASLDVFVNQYDCILETLERLGKCDEMLADSSTGQDAEIVSFNTITLMTIMLSILQETQPLSESLQKEDITLDKALSNMESVLVNLVELRS
uniref:DUF4371 domain-containing protein n=1 Tax=Latimeria chalumnae TaxID=7897 RepID=H2ZSF8_LATCH